MKKIKHLWIMAVVLLISSVLAGAVSADKKGCFDHPLFPTRMPEYTIENCDMKDFDAFNLETGKRDKTRIEGCVTKLTYRVDNRSREASGLAVVLNYENAIIGMQGAILFKDKNNNRIVNGKIVKNGKESWVQVEKGIGKIWLTVVERTENSQHVETRAEVSSNKIRTGDAALDARKIKAAPRPAEAWNLAAEKSKLPAKATVSPGSASNRIASLLAADAAKRTALEAEIAEKARPGFAKYSARMAALRTASGNRIAVSKLGVGRVTTPKEKPVPIKDPVILSTSPDAVAAGDWMTIIAANVTPSIEKNVVYFSYEGGGSSTNRTLMTVKPVSVSVLEDGNTALEVIVPRPDVSWYVSFARIYILTNDHTPGQTESVPFTFTNDVIGKINLVEPSEAGPKDWQTISGSNLKPDTEIHYRVVEGGLGDAVALTQYISSAKMRAQVPTYTATQPFNGYVYASTKTANNSIVNDRAIAFILKPTIRPTIGSIFQMQGSPGDPVIITGTGFAQPVEVHFLMSPTGPDLKADRIAGMTDTQITTYIPEFSGVAKPVDGFVYVKVGVVKSDIFPFKLVPTAEYKILNIRDYGASCVVFDNRNNDQYGDGYWMYTDPNTGKETGRIVGKHRGSDFEGHHGVDQYFRGVTLKNEWTVAGVDFGIDAWISTMDRAGASLYESHVGTTNPYVTVSWWNSMNFPNNRASDVFYWLEVTIKGPKGVSHK